MNTQTTTDAPTASTVYPETIVEEEICYPAELENEMGETAFHFKLIFLIYGFLESFYKSRKDVAIAATMMVYYDEGNPRKWLAPDVFVCFGVENKLRRTFKT